MVKSKLAVISTHPIQYLVPLYRTIVDLNVGLCVYYASDFSVRGALDPGFKVNVAWDIPVLQGYPYQFLSHDASKTGLSVFFADFYRRILNELKKHHYRAILVQGYTPDLFLQAILAAKRIGVPILMRGENTDQGKARNFLKRNLRNTILRVLYRQVAVCLPIGKNSYAHYCAHEVPENRLVLSPYCVDNDFFHRQFNLWNPRRSQTRQELGIGENDLVVLYAGKFIPEKDIFTLAKAIGVVTDPVAMLWIGDGPVRQELQEMCLAQNNQRHVFVGFQNQSQISKYYAAADVLVLPSISETWGLVVNEFMNFARPVIVSDRVGCAPDLVSPGETGFIFPAGDAGALVERIETLARERALLETMGQNAIERVSQYSLERAAQGIIQALELVGS